MSLFSPKHLIKYIHYSLLLSGIPTPKRLNNPHHPTPYTCSIEKTLPHSFITAILSSHFSYLSYHKYYASAIRASSYPTPYEIFYRYIPPSSITSYIPSITRKLYLNNIIHNFTLVIEHFKPYDMNTYFIS